MPSPDTKQWHKEQSARLYKILWDVFSGIESACHRYAGGGDLAENAVREIARRTGRRVYEELRGELGDDPLEICNAYITRRIKEGVISRESVRIERNGATYAFFRESSTCPYVNSCREVTAKWQRCMCTQRIFAEQLLEAATGRPVESRLLRSAEDGECSFEMEVLAGARKDLHPEGADEQTLTEHMREREEWQDREAQYKLLLETIADAIVVVDESHVVTYINPRACGVFGIPPAKAVGAKLARGGVLGRIGDLCVEAGEELGDWEGNRVIENRDGDRVHNIYLTRFSPVYSRERKRLGTMIVLDDMTREEMLHRKLTAQAENLEKVVREKTRELKEANAKLEILARTDSLTGLANRRTFEDVLRMELLRASRYRHTTGVLMVDVDDFKKVNDEQGHQAGDMVLKYVARILSKSVRASDTVARWGGDEFILLLPQAAETECKAVSRRIAENLLVESATGQAEPDIPVSLSVGWGIDSTGNSEEVVAQADMMMYEVKASKKTPPGR